MKYSRICDWSGFVIFCWGSDTRHEPNVDRMWLNAPMIVTFRVALVHWPRARVGTTTEPAKGMAVGPCGESAASSSSLS